MQSIMVLPTKFDVILNTDLPESAESVFKKINTDLSDLTYASP